MKTIFVVVLLLVFAFFMPVNVFGLGWLPPPSSGGGGGAVSAPEPGTITLIGMAVSAGAGYLLGKRKK